MGIRDKSTAPASPCQNSFAERMIGSIRRERVDHLSSSARHICAGFCELTPAITMTAERIGHWTKMRQSLALFNGLESSVHARYLANLTTTMSKFRLSVNTACRRHLASHRDTAQALNARGMRQLCSQRRICFSVRPLCSKSPTASLHYPPPAPRASHRRSSRPRRCGRWDRAPACRRDSRCP